MKKQLKYIAILSLVTTVPNVASAKSWYGPPAGVVIAIQIGLILLGIGIATIVYRVIKSILGKRQNKKR